MLTRPQPNMTGRSRLGWKILVVFTFLSLVSYVPAYPADAPVQGYDSLRLLIETMYEISHKYVWQKGDEEMMEGAIRGMINSLDPDSSFLTPQEYQNVLQGKKGQTAEAGVEWIFKDNLLTVASALEGGPGYRAGLRQGDHILKINDQMVRNLTSQEAARRFQGPPNTAMKLQVLRNGVIKPLDLTITLEPLSGAGVSAQMLKDSVAYIRIPFFNDETFVQLTSALKGLERQTPPLKGLILDLRNNARGTLEQGVRNASAWLGEKQIVSTKGRTPEVNQSYQGKAQDLVFKSPLPMVVLMDQGTGRAAEIVAGALKDQWGATLLGDKSLGLCALTRVVPLQDGSALVMTVAQCYTPKGQKIQGKGLEPDVQGKKASVTSPAKEPPKTLTPDQDPWVNQALEVIKSGKSPKLAVKGQS